eukprot:2584074-Rhodomonas_salina.1
MSMSGCPAGVQHRVYALHEQRCPALEVNKLLCPTPLECLSMACTAAYSPENLILLSGVALRFKLLAHRLGALA